MSEISDPKCTPYGMEASQKEKNKEREKLDVMLFPGEDFRYCSVVAFMGNIVTVHITTGFSGHCFIYRILTEDNSTIAWNSIPGYGY